MDLPPPSGTPASGRLRLDRLLRELVEQAGDLLAAQQRLPALLDAVISISSDLSLDATLRRIVEAARLLVEARYGALGVIAEDGEQLSDFITVGIDPDVVSTVGDSPRGKGILGLIISDPHPLRLPDLTEHPKAYGFPPGHPAMRSFLGVPISVRGRVFGNLYLTEKSAGAPFTPEDEGIVLALAGAAGVAIDNARLYEEAQRAQRDRGRLAVYEDRDRIARDLHDLVIQRLFATGLSLQGLGRFLQDSGAEARLERGQRPGRDDTGDSSDHLLPAGERPEDQSPGPGAGGGLAERQHTRFRAARAPGGEPGRRGPGARAGSRARRPARVPVQHRSSRHSL